MSRRKISKAREMRILDDATMTYRTVRLFNVDFKMKDGSNYTVQLYAPDESQIIAVATRLYSGVGSFVEPIAATLA